MRKLLISLVASLSLLGLTATANAATANGHGAMIQRNHRHGQCECVYWNAYAWGMKSEWTDNPNGFYERAWSFSRNNRTGATQTVDGPWRVNSFVYSNAPSPAGMAMVKGGYQKKESAGGKITTIQTYPS